MTTAIDKVAWVANLQDARTFQTRAAAEQECCENERVLPLEEAMKP